MNPGASLFGVPTRIAGSGEPAGSTHPNGRADGILLGPGSRQVRVLRDGNAAPSVVELDDRDGAREFD